MDIIQEIMLLFVELIERVKKIFSFVNSQFLPVTDGEDEEGKDYLKN